MKKTELYKIVKEALNEVLQEQRARRRRIGPTDKEKIRPKVGGCNTTSDFGNVTVVLNDPENVLGNGSTSEGKGCQQITINQHWVCCSDDNNNDSTAGGSPFQEGGWSHWVPNNNFGIGAPWFDYANGTEGCFTPEGNTVTAQDYVNWVANEEINPQSPWTGAPNYESVFLSTFCEGGEEPTLVCNNSEASNYYCDNVPEGAPACTGANEDVLPEGYAADNTLCESAEIEGCTDPAATNYNSSATNNDGSCTYGVCNDSTATNYYCNNVPSGSLACVDGALPTGSVADNTLCIYPTATCNDVLADNYNAEGACKYSFCNDDNAYNYSSTRPDGALWNLELDTVDNSKCEYEGCPDNGAASSESPSTVVPNSDPVQYYYHQSNSGCQSSEGGAINGLTSTGDLNPENKNCCPVEEPTEKKCRRIVAKVCNPTKGIVPQTLTLPCVSIDGEVAEVGDQFKYGATYMMEEQFDPSKLNLAPDLGVDKLKPRKVRAVYRVISSQIADGQTSIEDLQSGNCKGKMPQLDPVLSLPKKAPVSPVDRDVEDSRKLREQIRKTLLNKKMKKSELKEIIKEEIKKLKSLKEQITDWDGNCSSVLNTWSDIDDLKSLCIKCNPDIGGPGSYYMAMDPSPCGCDVPSSGGIMKPLLDFCRDKFTGAELGYGDPIPVGDPVPDPNPSPDDLTFKPTKYNKEPKPSKDKLPGGPSKTKNPSGVSILKKMLRDKSRR